MDSNRVQVSAKFKSPKSSTLMKIRSKTSVGNSKNGATGSLISSLNFSSVCITTSSSSATFLVCAVFWIAILIGSDVVLVNDDDVDGTIRA